MDVTYTKSDRVNLTTLANEGDFESCFIISFSNCLYQEGTSVSENRLFYIIFQFE